MSQSPVPPNDPDLARWAQTFGAKFPNHAATLGFSAGEVAGVQADTAYLVYLIQVRLPAEKSTLAATVEFKEFMKTGDAGAAIPTPLPGVSSPPPYPEPVPPPGIVFRLRKLVQNIKSRPRYTEVIGRDLGIIVGKGADAPEAPVLVLISAVAGGVTLGWNKGGRTGVKLQARRGDGAWSDLGVDLFSPYVDERPLAVPGQPETREYRACYLDGDTALPVFSAVLQVTATP